MKLKEKLQNILNAIALNLKSWKSLKQSATSLRNKLAGSLREKTENSKKTWNWIENIIYWWKRNEYSNLTKEEMEKLEELKEKYLKKFEELDKCGLDYRETPEVLSGSTGTTVSDVEFVIKHTHDFVKNSKGKII